MERKQHMDAIGAVALVSFATLFAFNQVVVKVTGGGFGPVFMAGLRSAGAIVVLALWMRTRGIAIRTPQGARFGGVIAGLLFAAEFLCIFIALDLTTVARASIIFYSMPVWLALAAHFLLPSERLTLKRSIGLLVALGGVAVAMLDRSNGQASLTGDILALVAAIFWAGIALTVRLTDLSKVPPEMQLFWQVLVSAPILLVLGVLSGDMIRDPVPLHYAGLAFQVIGIATFGFLSWFWLLSIYPASSVASFSFLSPVLAVILGWLILDEIIGIETWIALAMVAVGIHLINRK